MQGLAGLQVTQVSELLEFAKSEFEKRGAVAFGASRFSRVPKFPKGAELPEGTLLCGAFPYYAGEEERANISLYARGVDYHKVVGARSTKSAARSERNFPARSFSAFATKLRSTKSRRRGCAAWQ